MLYVLPHIRATDVNCQRIGKTPYESLTGKKPNISKMSVFGTTCFAYIQNKTKLDPRSEKGIFVE